MRLFLCLLISLSLSGCAPRERGNEGETCRDPSDCTVAAGELAACVQNECKAVDCLGNADCDLGSWCDVEGGDYACVPGCQTDVDCRAGESCSEEGTCLAYGCRNTNLDCEIGEVCDPDTRECERADGLHCQFCTGAGDWEFADQGTLDPCDDEWTGHGACGGEGAQCRGFEQGGAEYCMVPCGADDACPRGYTCIDLEVVFNLPAPSNCSIGGTSKVCISSFGCEDLY